MLDLPQNTFISGAADKIARVWTASGDSSFVSAHNM